MAMIEHPQPWNARRIRALRESQGWSQEGLAQQLGWSARSVWRWENGDKPSARAVRDMDAVEQMVLAAEARGAN